MAAPIDTSPAAEKHQSRAARTLSISRLERIMASGGGSKGVLRPAGIRRSRKNSVWRRSASSASPLSCSFSKAYARIVSSSRQRPPDVDASNVTSDLPTRLVIPSITVVS
jgi:hypothetical protein